jgi:hypothetical protein
MRAVARVTSSVAKHGRYVLPRASVVLRDSGGGCGRDGRRRYRRALCGGVGSHGV